jgi:hypothetical protein
VPPKLDLGVVTQNQPTTAKIELRNPGNSAVRLGTAASSKRCRWQGLPEELAPGAVTPLSVICQSDLMGPLQEQLILLDASQSDVLATLSIVARIEPLIGFDTSFVDLRPEFGHEQSADIHLVGPRAKSCQPKVIATGSEMVRVTLLPADAGRQPGLRVTCRADKVGMHAGSLVVETGVPEQPTLALSWGCRVPGTLEVTPATPYFNLRASGERATSITVKSSHPGFAVKSTRILEGPFTATIEKPNPDRSVPITIRVKNQEISDDARAATGKLLIQSNDPREPNKEVPLFGFGKINKVAPN